MDARLEPYRVVVSFLGEALGPDYEVVLHDLTSEDGTIVAIVNNHISGRTEGAHDPLYRSSQMYTYIFSSQTNQTELSE